jgi:hypothetical protein
MRRLAVAVGQWLTVAALYLGFAGSAETAEAGAAAVAGTLIVGFIFWCRHARTAAVRVRASWLRILPRVLRALCAEAVVVGGALLRALPAGVRAAGAMRSQPFDPDGHSAPAAGRRALAVLAASAAPDGYVVAVSADSLLLHRLVPRPPSPDRRWPI